MLKGVPAIVSPELLDTLMRMGHGDEIVFADANFPSDAIARSTTLGAAISLTGVGTVEVLGAALTLLPLDAAVEQPVVRMDAPPELGPQLIHRRMAQTLEDAGYSQEQMEALTRFAFYERAKRAYAVVRTSEGARFGNLIIKKGVVKA